MHAPSERRHWYWVVFLCLAALALTVSSCTPAEPAQPPTPTERPPPSDTPTPAPTDTPEPTATPPPTSTLTPTPTQTATPDAAATAAFEATQAAEVLIENIEAELLAAGFDPQGGSLAYHSTMPVTMRLDSYRTHRWLPLAAGQSFTNFALRADVTWESTSGYALCGFWLRGESLDADAEHVTFEAIRLSGAPLWSVEQWRYNRIESHLVGNPRSSPEINQEQGSTNQYLFVMQGTTLSIFVNGESLGRATVTRPLEGLVAFYIRQESGETMCSFDNAWVWELPATEGGG